MPRICTVPTEVIIEALRRNIDSLKDSEGNIFGPTFEIWKNIAEKLGTSSKNVYTFMKLNRHNVWEQIGMPEEISGTVEWTAGESAGDVSIEEVSEEEGSSESVVGNEKMASGFYITLSPDEWNSIKPHEKIYRRSDGKAKRRRYLALKAREWTRILSKKLWDVGHEPGYTSNVRRLFVSEKIMGSSRFETK